MSCAQKTLLVLMLLAPLGLWGCGQSRSPSSAARIRDLEARNTKLEEDYRASVAESAEVRKKLVFVEEQAAKWAEQAQQVPTVTRERDRLRQQVASTLSERNSLHAQMVHFSRELQNLAGKVDAAAGGSSTSSLTSATIAAPNGKS